MSISKKGKKGFVTIDSDQKKEVRIVSYLTKNESEKLKDYCIKNNLKSSVVIRDLIISFIG